MSGAVWFSIGLLAGGLVSLTLLCCLMISRNERK